MRGTVVMNMRRYSSTTGSSSKKGCSGPPTRKST